MEAGRVTEMCRYDGTKRRISLGEHWMKWLARAGNVLPDDR